jgi:hypothetical protein
VPLLHFLPMLCAPSKVWPGNQGRNLVQSGHHKRFRQDTLVGVSVTISVGRKMGSADTFDSAGYRPEGPPKFRLSIRRVDLINVCCRSARLSRGNVNRDSVGRPIGDVITGIQARERSNSAAVERPNSPRSAGFTNHWVLAFGRRFTPNMPSGVIGLESPVITSIR